jgi:Arc/MetJ-type ribon-helix-helix transcriptional regulator
MEKTTVYLPSELKRSLASLAREQGRSEAELIRAAIGNLVADELRPRPTLPLFKSEDPTLAERVDEALADFGS